LSHMANVNMRMVNMMLPLHVACGYACPEIVRLVALRTRWLNDKDKLGNTAMQTALLSPSQNQKHDVVKELLRQGAPIDLNHEAMAVMLELFCTDDVSHHSISVLRAAVDMYLADSMEKNNSYAYFRPGPEYTSKFFDTNRAIEKSRLRYMKGMVASRIKGQLSSLQLKPLCDNEAEQQQLMEACQHSKRLKRLVDAYSVLKNNHLFSFEDRSRKISRLV